MAKRKKTITSRYNEGDVFAAPLPGGGWCAALVWRTELPQRHRNVFLAGFNRAFPSVPVLAELDGFTVLDIWAATSYFDNRLKDGTWRFLGRLPQYSREAFPLPLLHCDITDEVLTCMSQSIAVRDVLCRGKDLEPELRELLFNDSGLGTEDGLPSHLANVMANPDTSFWRRRITPESLRAWQQIRARYGYPEGPEPPPYPAPKSSRHRPELGEA